MGPFFSHVKEGVLAPFYNMTIEFLLLEEACGRDAGPCVPIVMPELVHV